MVKPSGAFLFGEVNSSPPIIEKEGVKMMQAFMEHPVIFTILVISVFMIISMSIESTIRHILNYKSAKMFGMMEEEDEHGN